MTVFYIGWAILCIVVYSIVLAQRRTSWRLHRDKRAMRDMAEGIGLFITALASAGTIIAVAGSQPDLRLVTGVLSLGAFLGVGIIMATEGVGREGD